MVNLLTIFHNPFSAYNKHLVLHGHMSVGRSTTELLFKMYTNTLATLYGLHSVYMCVPIGIPVVARRV